MEIELWHSCPRHNLHLESHGGGQMLPQSWNAIPQPVLLPLPAMLLHPSNCRPLFVIACMSSSKLRFSLQCLQQVLTQNKKTSQSNACFDFILIWFCHALHISFESLDYSHNITQSLAMSSGLEFFMCSLRLFICSNPINHCATKECSCCHCCSH